MNDWPQRFLQSRQAGLPYESVTAVHPQLTLDEAYALQHAFVNACGATICGYKAALTSSAAQRSMGIDFPIVGALFASGDFTHTGAISASMPLLLEVEIGFTTARAISQPVTPDDVLDAMSEPMAMVEIAAPNLTPPTQGLDLVATNAASYGFLIGAVDAIGAPEDDLDSTVATLYRQDERVLSGRVGDVLGGQRNALAWLINEVLARGYRIDAGQLLMTGSIGGMCPASPGRFHAEWGNLARLTFDIAPP